MILRHGFIKGQTLHIDPMIDKSYPNHSAFMSVKQDWKSEYHKTSYCACMKSQEDAIKYAKQRGYIVPIGF